VCAHCSSIWKLTETSPFTKLLSIGNLDERDLVLRAQGHDQLLVRLFLASFVEDAHVSLTPIEGLAGFAETTGETVVDECDLEDTLQGLENGHLAFACGGIAADFNFVGRSHRGLGFLFSVRLMSELVLPITV
jgi:hypothetical protein